MCFGMEAIIKSQNEQWRSGIAKGITFIVTKDCQLACKYCYLVGKNSKERMPWSIAKQTVDYILDHENDFKEESVIWDFIGGEPFLEIDLIDKICDYIKMEMFRRTIIGSIPIASLFPQMVSTTTRRKFSNSLRRIATI